MLPDERQTHVIGRDETMRFPEDVPLMLEHMARGWTVNSQEMILRGLLSLYGWVRLADQERDDA